MLATLSWRLFLFQLQSGKLCKYLPAKRFKNFFKSLCICLRVQTSFLRLAIWNFNGYIIECLFLTGLYALIDLEGVLVDHKLSAYKPSSSLFSQNDVSSAKLSIFTPA